ncbi:hypothetical protein BLD25_04745 [Candidatus Gracilibacteria bacterium GN02-872]|nr:hypothetical protein BLD25_04745 [Candidatus Gracilibacteria bacterium GN02-872]
MKFDKKIGKNKGFTIVELIISVMILIILITISTISYSRYTSIARDGSRMADVNNISKSLELLISTGFPLPEPDGAETKRTADIQWLPSGVPDMEWKVGEFGEEAFKKTELSKLPVDPRDNQTKYKYAVSSDGSYFAVVTGKESSSEGYVSTNATAKSRTVAVAPGIPQVPTNPSQNPSIPGGQGGGGGAPTPGGSGGGQGGGGGGQGGGQGPQQPPSQPPVQPPVTPGGSEETGPTNVPEVSSPTEESCFNVINDPNDSSAVILVGRKSNCTKTSLIVPNKINGKTVKSISAGAFKQVGITSFVSNTIKEVKEEAFYGNTSLGTVKLMSLQKVGNYAFFNTNLLTVDFRYLTEVGDYAFYGNKFVSIDFPNLKTIGDYAFQYNKLTKVILPKVKTIGQYAFFQNIIQGELNLPKVETIGQYAFYGARNTSNNQITKVVLPEVNEIGGYAFGNNYITEVNIPKVKVIKERAFFVNEINKLELSELKTIGNDAFNYNKLKSVRLAKVEEIGNEAFSGGSYSSGHKNNITDLDLGNSIRKIGNSAFTSNDIYYLTLPESLLELGSYAFYNNPKINSDKSRITNRSRLSSSTLTSAYIAQ